MIRVAPASRNFRFVAGLARCAGSIVVISVSAGCVPAPAGELPDDVTDPEKSTPEGAEASAEPDDELGCPATVLDSLESFQFDGVLGTDDIIIGSCADRSGPEGLLSWTVPTLGIYDISVLASDFEAKLVLLDGGCDAPEIACRTVGTATTGGAGSRIELQAGQNLLIAVDADRPDAAGTFRVIVDFLGRPWE